MPPKKSGKGKKKSAKKSKAEKEQEKLLADIATFEKCQDLHEAFIVRINRWIRSHHSRAIDLFRKFDTDGDGTLSYTEFHAGMRDLDAPCSTLELHVLVRLLDQNKDQQIDYREFSKGVRYFTPEEIVPDDGLPILRIHREDLDNCPNCPLKLWKPPEVKFPRFIQLEMKLLTFLRINSYPGHFQVLVHAHIRVQGLINVINEHHCDTLRYVKIYNEDSQGKRNALDPQMTLEDCGYLGGPKTKPQKLELFYDYTTEFHECPILMADDYFTNKENTGNTKVFQYS